MAHPLAHMSRLGALGAGLGFEDGSCVGVGLAFSALASSGAVAA